MSNFATVWRELVNTSTTPEEERVWLTWWAQHPDAAADFAAYAKEQEVLNATARQLQERGEDPGSPAAQALLVQQNELLARYRIRRTGAAGTSHARARGKHLTPALARDGGS